ncbi:MAG: helix-turn-helix domain-containing protein [Actinomycetota bacterium]|jgi:AraC-like DNA-binding protein
MSASRRRSSGPEWVRAWKPVVAGVHEVFHARFVDYAYPPHVHDAWTVFVVDDGWIRYDLETRARGAGGERVIILPPHLVHDGRAATGGGFRKRVLYLSADVLPERLIGPAVDRPDIHDPALLRAVHALHRTLDEPDDALEAEARLALVGDRLLAHLGDPPTGIGNRRGPLGGLPSAVPGGHPGRLAGDLRDLLDQRLFDRTTLAEAGHELGASPSHLVRSFTGTFGIAPHQYVTARRIDAARKRLLGGEPIALVAAGVGFYDQAHFTRLFKRHVGTPPGRYALSAGR